MSKKVVLNLDLHDDRDKQKAMKAVSRLHGIDSIAMDMKEKKLTVIGLVDPVDIVNKLRKFWHTDILSVGPAKEPEKKKEEKIKDEPKKDAGKKEGGGGGGGGDGNKKAGGGGGGGGGGEKKKENAPDPIAELVNAYRTYNPQYMNPHMTTHYYVHSTEENPNACVIS